MYQVVVTLRAPHGISAVTPESYGFQGVAATAVAASGVPYEIHCDSTEEPIMATVVKSVKRYFLLGYCHGWKSLAWQEAGAEGSGRMLSTVEMIVLDFDEH